MNNDVKIIRLTFLTTFFHSLIMILLVIINLNDLLAKNYENWLYLGRVAEFFVQEINKNHIIAIVITVTILLFIGFSIVYPIWQSAIIHYIKDKRSIRSALKKWLNDFYPMFEFAFISMITSPMLWWLVAFRLFILWHHYSIVNIIWMWLWLISLNVANILKTYTRYCITLEDLSLQEALKRSFQLTRPRFFTSMKYIRIQTILLLNFSINVILVIWIPFLIIYLAISYNLIDYLIVKIFIYIVFVFLVLLSSYMSNFIRAFFAFYRYKLYNKIIKEKYEK